ncbi:MAG: hypothetical protein WBA17_09360 [Saprospiraceae bacterium]
MNAASSKLIASLEPLDAVRQRNCRKLLVSPFFNSSKDIVRLYDLLVKLLQQEKPIEKEEVWKKLFRTKDYNDVRFRKFCSDLQRLIEQYFVQEELQCQPGIENLLKIKFLNKTSVSKLAEGIDRNWDKYVNIIEEQSPDNYLYRHEMEKERYSLLDYSLKVFEKSNIEEMSESLDAYYISEKLRNLLDVQSLKKIKQRDYDIKMTDIVIQSLEKDDYYLSYLPIALYFFKYQVLTFFDREEYYYAFRDRLLQEYRQLSPRTAADFFQTLLNYCVRKANAGKGDFLEEYIKIYQQALTTKLLFENGILPPGQFKNTITVALRLNKYEWTADFINNYKQFLPTDQRDNAVTYNSATLYFYQKDYNKVLGYLHNVEYEDLTYNINSKAMLLATYYETKQFDTLDSLFDSFTTYLTRHKEIPENYKQLFRNLISYTRRLTRWRPGDYKTLDKIREELAENRTVASLNWLLEKVAELDKRRPA